jgi:hypothetical protein
MFNSRALGFLVLLGVLTAPRTAAAQQPLQLSNYLDVTQMRISSRLLNDKQPPELVARTLAQDRRIVEQSAAAVSGIFKDAKYSSDEATRGVGWNWYSTRVGKRALTLQVPLSQAVLQTRATDMGRLFISSQPDQAVVFIDQDRQIDPTNSDTFPDVGRRVVRIEKAGFQAAEAVCMILRDVRHTFTATLLPSGSTASCK